MEKIRKELFSVKCHDKGDLLVRKALGALALLLTIVAFASSSYADHPLITDDTYTQGAGRFQLEINGQYGHDRERKEDVTLRNSTYESRSILSYGVADAVDLILGVPYQSFRTREDDVLISAESGLSDTSLEAKWRFYQNEGLSLAFKPGITLPTGDEERGLGSGRVTFTGYFIATKETGPFEFHFNAAYIRNENKVGERETLWHISLACEVEIFENFRLVGNVGANRNPDPSSSDELVFILGGAIYSLRPDLDLDVGIRADVTDPARGYALLAGVTFRF